MQSEIIPLHQVLSNECGSAKKLNNSEHASAYETLSEKMNDDYDPASDAQSVAYHSDKIESPKQDPELDEYVEGSDKPINFSALKD